MEQNTVLFVDDDVNVLNSLKRGLIDENYRCLFVDNAKEAFKLLDQEDISVIVTDMRMPEINGLDLLKKVKESHPHIIRIVLSGYTQLPQVLAAVNQGDIYKFITKPWDLDKDLIPTIREAIEYFNLMKKKDLLSEDLKRKNDSYRRIIELTRNRYDLFHENIMKIDEIGTYVLRNIKQKAIEEIGQQSKFVNMIEIYEGLYRGYVTTLPSKNMDFDINKFVNELNHYFSTEDQTKHLKIRLEGKSDFRCQGNYKLLTFILFAFYRYLLKYHIANELPVTLTIEDLHQTLRLDFFSMVMLKEPDIINKSLNDQSQNILDDMNIIRSFLEQISKSLNGSFTVYETKGNIYTKLQFIIKKA
ncbi:response regulator [Tepidibacillus sp. LV47]|uniref:response regulator n=1 Tax=Tepidibacillus sp. LV47 TaxID=3398228 RepID=UPI003AAF7918